MPIIKGELAGAVTTPSDITFVRPSGAFDRREYNRTRNRGSSSITNLNLNSISFYFSFSPNSDVRNKYFPNFINSFLNLKTPLTIEVDGTSYNLSYDQYQATGSFYASTIIPTTDRVSDSDLTKAINFELVDNVTANFTEYSQVFQDESIGDTNTLQNTDIDLSYYKTSSSQTLRSKYRFRFVSKGTSNPVTLSKTPSHLLVNGREFAVQTSSGGGGPYYITSSTITDTSFQPSSSNLSFGINVKFSDGTYWNNTRSKLFMRAAQTESFAHIFLGSKPLHSIYKGETLIWENLEGPTIQFFSSINAGSEGIDLDTRPSGNITLFYKAPTTTTNTIHNDTTNKNVPILFHVVSTPSNTWGLGTGLFLGAFNNRNDKRWVINDTNNQAQAYNLTTGVRLSASANDIFLSRIAGATNNLWKSGCWAKGAYWLLNDHTLYYVSEQGIGVTENHTDLNTLFGTGGWERVFTDGETIWCIDNTRDYAYSLSATTRQRTHQDINLGAGTWYGGTICKGAFYFLDGNNARPVLKAWTYQDRQRRSQRDFSLPTTGNPAYRGLDCHDDKLYVVDDQSNNLIEREFIETQNVYPLRIPQYDFDLGTGNWRGATVKDNLVYIIDDLAVNSKKYARNFDISNISNISRGQTSNDLELSGIGSFAKGIAWWDVSGSEAFYVSDNTGIAKAYNSSLAPVSGSNISHGNTNIERAVRQKVGNVYTLYFIDNRNNNAIAIDPATRTAYDPTRNFSLGSGNWLSAEYIEDVGFYLYNASSGTNLVKYFNASRTANTSLDLTSTNTLFYDSSPIKNIRGSFSKGNILWLIDDVNNKAFAYYVNIPNISIGSVTIPQATENQMFRLVSTTGDGASHKELTIRVTENLVISNYRRTGFRQSEIFGRPGGLYSFAFRIKGYPQPNRFVFSGVQSHTTDGRHLTPVAGQVNTWDFSIDLNIGADSGNLTVTATNGASGTGGTATATISID